MDMAVIAVILGGLFGFANFLAALIIYDMGFFAAIGIYSASGTLLALCIILLTAGLQMLAAREPMGLQTRDTSSQQF